MTLSKIYRDIVISQSKLGKSGVEIKKILGEKPGLRTITRWISEYKTSGKTEPARSPGRPRTKNTQVNQQKIKALLKKKVSARGCSRKLKTVSYTTVRRSLRDMNLKVYSWIEF